MAGTRPDSEKGASLLIVAGSLLMLMGMAALAVDLSALRADIRADRLAADAAATAGVIHIEPFSGSHADQACEAAWDYLLLNLGDEGASVSPPNCSAFASACNPSIVRTATASAGPYSFVITHPVLDGNSLMAGQAINADVDGAACQRLGVEVARQRPYNFAPVLGFESGSTTVASVARIAIDAGEPEVVPLLVLEPVACDALFTSGQGKVTVAHFADTPGIIVVDSDGSGGSGSNACSTGNRYTIDSKGTQNGWIRALPVPAPDNIPSAILSYALSGNGPANASKSYDPGDLTAPVPLPDPYPAATRFRLFPHPQPVFRRITRAPIDWRYNCKSNYPDYLGFVPVDPCPNASAPHIDQHVTAYGGNLGPPGFGDWLGAGQTCTPAADVTVSGDWWVNCPGGFIVNGVTVTFNGSNVVFDGHIDVRSDGRLLINDGAGTDHFVYVRDTGRLLKGAQSQIVLDRTFVYLEDGYVDLVGGNGGLTWTAPIDGNFEDLALWAEAPVQFQIGGQAANTLTGTFFTPLSDPFTLTGQAGQFQTDAQFLTRRLEVGGQGEVLMHPDPTRQTLIPVRAVRLIR